MSVEKEILQYSYWEHFKAAKDLSRILPPKHPKILRITEAINDILEKINIANQVGVHY